MSGRVPGRHQPDPPAPHPTQALDDIVHHRARLGILAVLREVDQAEFGYLRDTLGLTTATSPATCAPSKLPATSRSARATTANDREPGSTSPPRAPAPSTRNWRPCARSSPAWTTPQAPRPAQPPAHNPPRPDRAGR